MIEISNPYFGKTIEYSTLKEKLSKLNSNVRIDERNDDHIYAQGFEPRTGIWFGDQHICNVERVGAIPQYSIYGLPKEDLFPIAVEDCLMDERIDEDGPLSYFMTIIVDINKNPQKFFALNKMIGNQMEMIAIRKDFTGGELLLERIAPDQIAVFTALGRRICSTRCLRIGWTHVFRSLISRNIPNITADSLSKAFNVTWDPNIPSDVQLRDEIRDLQKR